MHYNLVLHQYFEELKRTETSIEQLASIWHCSERYAKIVIKQLQQQQKVLWETSQGRGKKPFLTLCQSKTDAVIQVLQQLWLQKKYEEVFQLVKDVELQQNPSIQAWMNAQFGLHALNEEHVFVQPMYFVELFLDPLKAISRHDMHILEQMHESLFIINERSEIESNLLFDYNSEDYRTWHFVLRKGVLFHNLEELTASDAVESIRYVKSYYKNVFTIESMQILGRYTFSITLHKPLTILPNFLASIRFSVFYKGQEPTIGCGPFQLVTHTNERMRLQTFTRYFKQRPWIDAVELIYQDFEADVVSNFIFHTDVPYREIISQEQGADFFALNSTYGELTDRDKRAYIWHLIEPTRCIVDHERETLAGSWLVGQSNKLPVEKTKKPYFSRPLVIGYQEIRQGVNHLYRVEPIQQLLLEQGIESTTVCIDLKHAHEKIEQKIDIFVGGNALSDNLLLAYFMMYSSEPQIFFNFLLPESRQIAEYLLQQATSQKEGLACFKQIEQLLIDEYTLKFISHRKHYFYVREDTPYKHVEFDQHGRVNYRRIFYKDY
ncbi:MAG: ABC transporter substrate-binding protein [Solibacillus sp.]